jgi:hypothetical protein
MRENVKAQTSMISPNTAMATAKVTFVGKMDYCVINATSAKWIGFDYLFSKRIVFSKTYKDSGFSYLEL